MIIEFFSLLRLCIGSCLLVYASYSDVKTREVSDLVWILMGVSGGSFILVELFIGSGSLSLFQLILHFSICNMESYLYIIRGNFIFERGKFHKNFPSYK